MAPSHGAVEKASAADPPYDPAEIIARVGSERIQACEVLPMITARPVSTAVTMMTVHIRFRLQTMLASGQVAVDVTDEPAQRV